MSLVSHLEGAKVIVSCGTGGVGKTTVSAALGATMARRGKRVLVLTIDPAKRLAQALGLEGGAYEATKVEGVSGELYASMIDAKRIFDRFVERFSPTQEVTEKLKANRLYQQLVTALTGSQEFTSMDRLLTEHELNKYDLIILDTPPTQNAVDFLRAPKRIVGLFDERVTKWFIQTKQVSFLSRIVSKGTQTALAALEKVTGSEFIGELSDFFEQMSHIQSSVSQRTERVEVLLKQDSTKFVIVTSADDQKLEETKEFSRAVYENGYHLTALLLNRAYPEWLSDGVSSSDPFFQQATRYYDVQRQKVTQFKKENSFLSTFVLPEVSRPLNGVEDIVKLSQVVEEL